VIKRPNEFALNLKRSEPKDEMAGDAAALRLTEEATVKPPRVNPETWLDLYGDWLYQYAMARVRDSHAAEDLVQETLAAGFRGFDGYQQRSTVKTWLTTIMRRRIADYLKKNGRHKVVADAADLEDENDHFGFSVAHSKLFHPKISNEEFRSSVEREEFVQAVQDCMNKLPSHLRQAFAIRIADDERPLEELSQELNVTRNNLSVRLFRSRLLIRACLERRWTGK